MEKALKCFKCYKVPQPCCEDKYEYLKRNIEYLKKKLLLKPISFPYLYGSVGCFHCGFLNGELTAIGNNHHYLIWSTYENIQNIEKNLLKAFNDFLKKEENTTQANLQVYKQIIDDFFRASSGYLKKLNHVSVQIV